MIVKTGPVVKALGIMHRKTGLVLNKEWGTGVLGLLLGTSRDYHRDPFPHPPKP